MIPHEIFYSNERSISLEWSGNALKVKEFSDKQGYGVRVLKNKKVGFAYTEQEEKIDEAIKKAEEISKFSPSSDFSFQPQTKFEHVKTFDKHVALLDEKLLKEILDELKDAALKYAKRTRIILTASQRKTSITNSEGLSCGYNKTLISIYIEAMKDDGFGFLSYSGIKIPLDIYGIGTKAGEMACAMKSAKKIDSGNYMVVFSADAFHQLLSILLPSFSGDWKRRRISKLCGNEGKRVFDEKFSLYESPLVDASNTRPFDDEGCPSHNFPLIEEGVVKEFMYDRETAALVGLSNKMGCCVRASYEALPSAGNSNLVIKGASWTNLEEELKECLVVHSIHGVHTANTTTGDFGVEANIAFHIKNGKPAPKRGFMISGNIFSLLSSIEGIEKNALVYHNIFYPRMAFRDVHVIG